MALTDSQCRAVKATNKVQKLSDSGGLYLQVATSGSKLWRLNYRFDGKQKTLALGKYPEVTISAARTLRDNAKRALADGVEPSTLKSLTPGAGHDSFEAVAKEWHKAQSPSWTPAHAERVMSRFTRDVFPEFGKSHIGDVTAPMVLKAIRKIEDRKAFDISKRTRQSVSQVFKFAIAIGKIDRDPAADITGALVANPKPQNFASIKQAELPEFLKKLRAYDGELQTRLALELVMRTAVRSNEIRFGKWSEIDRGALVWRIPAERMKMGTEHIVCLSKQSLRLLDQLREIAGDSEWIVPGDKGKPISENTLLFALYRLGYHSRATVHGFRGTFSTIANESGLWSSDAIELTLAHVHGNAVRRAYNHAQRLDERRKLAQWWSDLLDKLDPMNLSALLD